MVICLEQVATDIRFVKKLIGGVLAWHLSGARCRFAYRPADVTATPSSLGSLKSRMVYLSGASLPRLSRKKALRWM